MINKDPRLTGDAWKTTGRKKVEAVLNGTRVGESSLSPQRIASLSGVDLGAARSIIKSMVTAKQAVNAGTPQQPKYRKAGGGRHRVRAREDHQRKQQRFVSNELPNLATRRNGAHEVLPSRMGNRLIFRDGTVADAC